jgi:hypothetical protein
MSYPLKKVVVFQGWVFSPYFDHQRLDGKPLKDWDYLDWENQPVESLGWPAKYEVLNFEPVESDISF